MRILEIETFGRGGLTHYAYNLSCALARRGHEVDPRHLRGLRARGPRAAGHLRVLKTIAPLTQRPGGVRPAFAAGLARKVEALVDAFRVALLARRLRPDVIHLHCTNPISLVYLTLLRWLGAPVVSTAHVVTPHERMPLQRAVSGGSTGSSDLVIAHSEFDRTPPARGVRRGSRAGGRHSPRRVRLLRPRWRGPGTRGGATEPRSRAGGRGRPLLRLHPRVQGPGSAARGLARRRRRAARAPASSWPATRSAWTRAAARELEAWATRLGAVHRFEYIPFSDVSRYFRPPTSSSCPTGTSASRGSSSWPCPWGSRWWPPGWEA